MLFSCAKWTGQQAAKLRTRDNVGREIEMKKLMKGSGTTTCTGEDAELFFPPHVDLGIYPGWLRKMALDRRPDYRNAWENSDSDAVSALIATIDAWDWLDHWGTVVYGGDEYLVSEPYHMNRDRVDELLRFCTDLNLAFNFQASGHHYPTKTMRIFVWPKGWPHGDYFLQEKEGYRMGLQPGQ